MLEIRQEYKVGIYCRLSQDDGNVGDSTSIQTQKMMLEKYCKDNNFSINDYYVDDGFSGGNFNRPAFQRLLDDIDNKRVNMIITKDLSRLGRDYIMTGYYTEIYFPDRNVRYIAINDNIDTLRNDNDIAPFKNILNDMFLKDISRKVKTARRQRAIQGLFQGGGAPYGYQKDVNNKNKLVIDAEISHVVRNIFNLVLSGESPVNIAKRLKQEKILVPAAYKFKNGDTRFENDIKDGYECEWTSGSVRRILRDPVYTGAIVNLRQQVLNYKTKRNASNPKDKWIIVPNMHEAIVSNEEFDRAQELMSAHINPRRKFDVENLFKGLVKCSVCGKTMILTTQMRFGKLVAYFRCNAFAERKIKCASDKHWTTIKYDDLKDIVTTRLKKYLAKYKDDTKMMNLIQNKVKDNKITVDYKKELSKIENRQNILVNITKKVYDDYFEGLISKDTYLDLIKKYQKEQNDLKMKYDYFLSESNKKDNQIEDVVQDFLDLKVLKKEIVYNLINKIEISNEGEWKQHKQRTIKITYQFSEKE